MIEDQWVTVEQTPLEAVAEMMRGRLEAEGIEAVLRGNRVSGAAGVVNEFNISWSNPLGGVEVRVRAENVQRAREILAVDERTGDQKSERAQTPFWIQWAGAALVASTLFYTGLALTENSVVAALISIVSFGAVLALGRRKKAA